MDESIATEPVETLESNARDLCEYVDVCEDIKKMKSFKQDELIRSDKEYLNLVNQYNNLCSNRLALKDRTLTCLLRDKIKNLKVDFEGRKVEIDELPDGYYFLRKKTHALVNSVRIKKLELREAINERIGNGWKEDEMVVESANIPFASIYKNL